MASGNINIPTERQILNVITQGIYIQPSQSFDINHTGPILLFTIRTDSDFGIFYITKNNINVLHGSNSGMVITTPSNTQITITNNYTWSNPITWVKLTGS